MTGRVTVTAQVSSVAQPAPDVPSGRLFIAGTAAGSSPATVVRVGSLAQFTEAFGTRAAANGALFDAVASFFAEGGAVAFVRAGTAPSSWSTFLDDFTADLGPGVVAIAGEDTDAVAAVCAHVVAVPHRTGVVCGPDNQTAAQAVSAVSTAASTAGADKVVYAWPWVQFDGAFIEPIGFVAAKRAVAHASARGAGQSPIDERYGVARVVDAVRTAVTDDQFNELNTGRVSVVRVIGSKLRLYGYRTLKNMSGDSTGNLGYGNHADLLASIQWQGTQIGERWVGRGIDGKGVALAGFAGDLTGVLAPLSDSGALFARVDDDGEVLDPGYVINTGRDINTPATLATGVLHARVGVRLAPSAEFVEITVSATDAAGNI